jgi:Pyridoxamine 5'-phosphate oxidase
MPTTTQPTVDRPAIPREYGVAKGPKGMLSWETVEEQLAAAKLFWVATSSSDGRPRVRPVDGTWFEGRIYVGGSPETAWVRDLLANPNVVVHLDSTDGIVIVDGIAESGGGGISGDAAERLADLLGERFPYGRPKAEDFAAQGSIAVRPRVIVAWRDFARDPTRFRFD